MLWVAGIIVLLPLFLVALILLLANIGPGRALIESQVKSLTGGMVVLNGLSGRFPDALRLSHGEIRDAKGAWLTLDGVTLSWSPTALLGGVASIDLLSVDHIALPRLAMPAAPAQPAKPSQGGGFSLPVRVDLSALHIAKLDVGAPVAGAAASVRIDGGGSFTSLDIARAKLDIQRLDGQGSYRLDGIVSPATISAKLHFAEPQGGLVSGLANLPALGALNVTASITGPRSAEQTELALSAGALKATGHGLIDLAGQSVALDVDANAPAMSPRRDISWSAIALQAHVHGPFKTPDVSAHAVLENFSGGGASIAIFTADAAGNRGAVDLHATLAGLMIPSAKPDIFATAPLDLTVHADLDKPGIPVRFALKHPLVTADGTAQAGGDISTRIHTTIPDLAPFAAIGGVDLRGTADAVAALATHGQDTDITLDGTTDFTGGQAPVPTLLGKTTFGVTARLTGQDIAISRAVIDGQAAHASVTGTDTHAGLALAYRLMLTDLAAASPQARGALQITGRADGPQNGLAVTADIKGDIGTATIQKGPLTLSVRAENVPSHPSGTIEGQGRFAGSPVAISGKLDRQDDGGFHAVLTRAAWKSFAASADLNLAKGATLPTGTFNASMERLADLATVTGQFLSGSFRAKITTQTAGLPNARIDIQAADLATSGAAIAHLSLTGNIRDPAGKKPDIALVLAAGGLDAANVTGNARLTANGGLDALTIHATSDVLASGAPATLTGQALLDLTGRTLTLQTLAADYQGEALRLAAPARVAFGGAIGIDRLRLNLGDATLDLSGKISPALDLTASLRNVTPALAKPFAPGLSATGLFTADARLTGTTAAPQGNIRLQATGFRMRSGPAASVPAASLLATIGLKGGIAQIDARIVAGPKLHLSAKGTAPIKAGGPLDIRASGGFDLTLLDPVLGASGRRAAGQLALDATISGTIAAPRIDGEVTLADGEVQDFAQGLRLTGITARLAEAGDTLTIQNFSAKAGPGTIALTGSVGVLAPGLPVDLHFTANNARPLSSDLLTAFIDADISVKGQAAGDMQAGGKIFIRRADINIPNALPPSVAVLNVRRPGYKPPPPRTTPPGVIHLDIAVDAPRAATAWMRNLAAN